MYVVRKLKECYIDKSIMSMFYKSVVESVLNFGLLNWYPGTILWTGMVAVHLRLVK